MNEKCDTSGTIDGDLLSAAESSWAAGARAAGIDPVAFARIKPLEERLKLAADAGLPIVAVYARTSGDGSITISDQVRSLTGSAGASRRYCPPEFVCADIGVSGVSKDRPGFRRVQELLKLGIVSKVEVDDATRVSRISSNINDFPDREDPGAGPVDLMK